MRIALKSILLFMVFIALIVVLVKFGSWSIERFERHEITASDDIYQFDVPCNRFHGLMLAFHITPPLPIKSSSKKPYTTGTVTISYSDNRLGNIINLAERGGSFSGGLWKQSIILLPSKFFRLCRKSTMTVEIKDLDIDLSKHRVQLYIMKDGRP